MMVKIESTKATKSGGAAACVFVLLVTAALTTTWATGTIDFTKLSGPWAGTETHYQKGQCSLGGPGRRHDSSPIRFNLDVAEDGSFTMVRESVGPDPQLALGRFNSDLSFTLAMPARAMCRDVPREYSIDFTGKVTQDKGRAKLKMEGLDVACPEYECRFLVMISAKQR